MATTRKSPPTERIHAALGDALQRHTVAGQQLVLGLSGGIDSVVLLHALQHPLFARYALSCVHIHHGLSPHADDWADFCLQLCTQLRVPIAIHRVDIRRDDPAGIEGAARAVRREIFARLHANAVLTAHHQNDQAETLLLQLLRGSGPKGLAGMAMAQQPPGWRPLHLRPLLDVTRAEIESYARHHRLTWITDESNSDVRYTRNYLRHILLPELAQRFPATVPVLARAAKWQADALAIQNDMAHADAQACMRGEHLDCKGLSQLSLPRARNLLRWYLERQGFGMPSERRLDEALRQLMHAAPDAQLRVALSPHFALCRYRDGICLVPVQRCNNQAPVVWHGEARVHLAAAQCNILMTSVRGEGLSADRLLRGHVTIGVRRGGESLKTPRGSRRLKNLLQEAGLPPWQRACVPLIWCDEALVWVDGIGMNVDFVALPDEPGVLPIKQ